MLLNERKGLSIWMNERPFFRQASSTSGVFSTMITGVISSSSILPSGVFAGSMTPFLPAAGSEQRRLQWRKQIALPDQRDSPNELLAANCNQTGKFHRRQWKMERITVLKLRRTRIPVWCWDGLLRQQPTDELCPFSWSNGPFVFDSSHATAKPPSFLFFLFFFFFYPNCFQ